MSDREKLIKLISWFCRGASLEDVQPPYGFENLADYLITNGVTFQKEGKWMKDTDIDSKYYGWICPGCGQHFLECTPYCSECGTKMCLEE